MFTSGPHPSSSSTVSGLEIQQPLWLRSGSARWAERAGAPAPVPGALPSLHLPGERLRAHLGRGAFPRGAWKSSEAMQLQNIPAARVVGTCWDKQ